MEINGWTKKEKLKTTSEHKRTLSGVYVQMNTIK